MRSRSSTTRFFLFLLGAIAATYLVGRSWLHRPDPTSTEAGILPMGPADAGR